ncbi:hypothetical protein ACQ4PT_026436 [Festuca glaucescens]
MDRSRQDRQPDKRSFADMVPPAERWRKLELCEWAEREQDLRRRDREREYLPERRHDLVAYVLADDTVASEDITNEGLKKLIDESWDFQVHKVADSEYAVMFPNADSLRLCKNAANLMLPVSKITVVVSEARPTPIATCKLHEVWVWLHDAPPQLLSIERFSASMIMLGKPILVDELSLSKDVPVLMKF